MINVLISYSVSYYVIPIKWYINMKKHDIIYYNYNLMLISHYLVSGYHAYSSEGLSTKQAT